MVSGKNKNLKNLTVIGFQPLSDPLLIYVSLLLLMVFYRSSKGFNDKLVVE